MSACVCLSCGTLRLASLVEQALRNLTNLSLWLNYKYKIIRKMKWAWFGGKGKRKGNGNEDGGSLWKMWVINKNMVLFESIRNERGRRMQLLKLYLISNLVQFYLSASLWSDSFFLSKGENPISPPLVSLPLFPFIFRPFLFATPFCLMPVFKWYVDVHCL